MATKIFWLAINFPFHIQQLGFRIKVMPIGYFWQTGYGKPHPMKF
jgi:hypothetical protein